MENKGEILSCDISKEKMRLLINDAERMGVSIVTPCVMDTSVKGGIKCGQMFHKILVDAPCSNLGLLRRHPEIRWKRKRNILSILPALQFRILSNVSRYLIKGGTLVYCVCSFEPEECEEVINKFLSAHTEFHIDNVSAFLSKEVLQKRLSLDKDGFLRLVFPDLDIDGFFIARLKKR